LLLKIVAEWPSDPRYLLVLCGSGPYEAELRAAARDRRNIEIQHKQDMAEVLADAKVFLSLQQWDNYPSQSLLEAMLCGCCVVATDVGDTRLLVNAPWGVCLKAAAPACHYIEAALRFVNMRESKFAAASQAA
jgi:glycosyltransferase involved in cell wall biosynthesis